MEARLSKTFLLQLRLPEPALLGHGVWDFRLEKEAKVLSRDDKVLIIALKRLNVSSQALLSRLQIEII